MLAGTTAPPKVSIDEAEIELKKRRMQELLDKAAAFTALKETGADNAAALSSPTSIHVPAVSATE